MRRITLPALHTDSISNIYTAYTSSGSDLASKVTSTFFLMLLRLCAQNWSDSETEMELTNEKLALFRNCVEKLETKLETEVQNPESGTVKHAQNWQI